MIIETLINTTPYNYFAGMEGKIDGTPIPSFIPASVSGLCPCSTGNCEYLETVFANLSDSDPFFNDRNDFIFRKFRAADTIDLELWKDGVKVADIVDDTYGTFFPSFTAQPLYVGFLIDWLKVANNPSPNVTGFGRYQVKAQMDITGNAFTIDSQQFKLEPFREAQANGTIKIESVQNGNIIGSEFDYTDLNWQQSIRIKGKFGNKQRNLEIDKYQDEVFKDRQIQDQVVIEYDLETFLLPTNIDNSLTEDRLLANSFTITDYNIINEARYRDVEVYPSSIESPTQIGFGKIYLIKFTERTPDKIKRNNNNNGN